MNIRQAIYPGFQTLLRLTVRRNEWRELQHFKKMLRNDTETLQRYSHEQSVAYVNRMAELSPGYRRKLDSAGIRLPLDNSLESWMGLPMITKADLQQDPTSWYSSTMNSENVSWTTTSGSTGQPFRFPMDIHANHAATISDQVHLLALGCRPGQRVASIKVKAPQLRGLRKIMQSVMGNVPYTFASRSLSPQNAPEVIAQLRVANVQRIFGYPSAMSLLAEVMLSKGLRCPIPIIFVYGEQMTPEARIKIERAFEGKVYRDYAASECLGMAYECKEQNGYHINLINYKIEILDGNRPVAPGENGDIVVTSFRNGAMPLIRYRIGDMATLGDPKEICPCGNPLPRISEILGRVVEVLHTPDGQKISEFFFDSFADALNEAHDHISRYQVIQKEPSVLEILWVPVTENSRDHLPEIEKRIIARSKTSMRLEWREVSDIPPDPSGKRKRFIPYRANGNP